MNLRWSTVAVAFAVVILPIAPAQADQNRGHVQNTVDVSARVTARATEVTVDSSWIPFSVAEAGSFSRRFTFSSAGPVLVTVTDVYCRGDKFRVFDGQEDLGLTSEPAKPDDCEEHIKNPDKALASDHFSHGIFAVGAGAHVLRIQIVKSPYGGAGAVFRLDPAPTPESKSDCKDSGWRALYTMAGHTFGNQGLCVSSVARG